MGVDRGFEKVFDEGRESYKSDFEIMNDANFDTLSSEHTQRMEAISRDKGMFTTPEDSDKKDRYGEAKTKAQAEYQAKKGEIVEKSKNLWDRVSSKVMRAEKVVGTVAGFLLSKEAQGELGDAVVKHAKDVAEAANKWVTERDRKISDSINGFVKEQTNDLSRSVDTLKSDVTRGILNVETRVVGLVGAAEASSTMAIIDMEGQVDMAVNGILSGVMEIAGRVPRNLAAEVELKALTVRGMARGAAGAYEEVVTESALGRSAREASRRYQSGRRAEARLRGIQQVAIQAEEVGGGGEEGSPVLVRMARGIEGVADVVFENARYVRRQSREVMNFANELRAGAQMRESRRPEEKDVEEAKRQRFASLR